MQKQAKVLWVDYEAEECEIVCLGCGSQVSMAILAVDECPICGLKMFVREIIGTQVLPRYRGKGKSLILGHL